MGMLSSPQFKASERFWHYILELNSYMSRQVQEECPHFYPDVEALHSTILNPRFGIFTTTRIALVDHKKVFDV